MGQKYFEALLPIAAEALAERIALEDRISKDNAMERLQTSALYPALEDEFSKVWYYSVSKLYALFKAGASF
jgi:hypothetical protein